MTKTGRAAFRAAVPALLLASALSAAEVPAGPPGPRRIPGPDMLFEQVVVRLKSGATVSGPLAGFDDESLYLVRPGGEVRVMREDAGGIELVPSVRRRRGLVPGMILGALAGWIGSYPSHGASHASLDHPAIQAILVTAGVTFGATISLLAESGPPARQWFTLVGEVDERGREWDRFRRLALDEPPRPKVRFAVSGGKVPEPVDDSVGREWSGAGISGRRSDHPPEGFDPFRRLRLSFAIRPGLEIAAVWMRMDERAYRGYLYRTEGDIGVSLEPELRTGADGYFLAALVRPWAARPTRPLDITVGAGAGYVRRSASVGGAVRHSSAFGEFTVTPSYRTVRAGLGACVFADAVLRVTPRLGMGIGVDAVAGPRLRLPAAPDFGLAASKAPSLRGGFGFTIEYGF